jgi:hypothetical protein
MKRTILTGISVLALAAASVGCSSSGSSDGGQDGQPSDGPVLFGLTTGDSCFDVVSIATGFDDGCGIGVDSVVGQALLVNYDPTTATVTVGTSGSLGGGVVTNNMGTLTRSGTTSDSTMPTCTWTQTDNSNINVIATNKFTLAVTETQSNFASACAATSVPTGGACSSMWTWTMQKGTKTPPGCN